MIIRMAKILDKHQKSRVFIIFIMIIFGAIFETVGVSAVLPLVSAVTDPTIIETNKYYRYVSEGLGIRDPKVFVLVMAIALIGIYIIKNAYLILLNIAQNHFTTNNLRRMSVRLMKCYMNQDYLYHSEHNVAELERNANRDVSSWIYVLTNVLQLITELLVCFFLSVFLLLADFQVSLMLITTIVVFLLFFMKIVKKRLKYYGSISRASEAEKNRFFLEAFGGIKEVKASGIEAFFVRRYDNAFKDFSLAEQKKLLYTFIPRPIMESLCICGLLLFMSIKLAMGADVNTFIPVMSVFAVAAIRMLPSFNRISGYMGAIMFYKASVDKLYADLQEAELLEKKVSVSSGESFSPGAIAVKDLSFSYPTRREKDILQSVDICIPVNKSVAFVGPSGSGKTTLADLVLGILNPDQGSVMVGDVDIRSQKKAWQKNIGYIPQNTFLIDDTIRANVAFGIEENEIDDKKVWEALEASQLADYVREQPEGIDSRIGDRGVKLSGGQRQRLGIARALYNNPPYIVLDEATSALDNETEKAVMNAIYQLAGKKTMIIIAHRLTTIKNCDIIYEVKDGSVKQVAYDEISH